MSAWIATLPTELQNNIHALVAQNPHSLEVLQALWEYKETRKRKKTDTSGGVATENIVGSAEDAPTQSQEKQQNELTTIIKVESIPTSTIIFSISQISFQSPLRKKMDLSFHLLEQESQPFPVLSIVNKDVPELSVINLPEAVRLCMLLPILGNSTTSKKNVVCLGIWLNHQKDPIICQLNFEQIKKQMIQEGKLPEAMAQEQAPERGHSIGAVNERIIDYFQRQFKLCGVNLINYLPCDSLFKNEVSLHTDSAISLKGQDNNGIVMIEAHKGSKDGSLVFLTSGYVIFGFKKPTLIFDIKKIQHTSYSNITRLTFSLLLTAEDDNGDEQSIEFSMIDQAYFQVIDDFIKSQNINDNSYDDKLREKADKVEKTEAGEVDDGTGVSALIAEDENNDSDSEEDEDYEGEGNDSDGESGSGESDDEGEERGPEAAESDSDSDLGSSEEEGEEEVEDDGVFHKNREEDSD